MKKTHVLLLLAFLFSVPSFAQLRTPAPSPSAKVTQMVGLTEVEVEYSRPSMKDRKIFGDLVPYGKMWRTGANAATKISFSTDVNIGGTDVKKGSYAILTVPNADNWAFHFYNYESGNWGSYVEKEPAAVIEGKVQKSPISYESFTIMMDGFDQGRTTMHFAWENTVVALEMDTRVDKMVMNNIEKMLAGPSASDYYAMGSYLYDSGKEGKDLEKALQYVQKATQADEPRFWQVRKEALILAKLGKTKEAIKAAQKSLALAEKAGNEDYVRMNKKSIEEWRK